MTAAVRAQLLAAGAKMPGKAPSAAVAATKAPQATPVPAAGREAVRAKKPRHLEDDLQTACVKWFRLQYPEYAALLFAIPNGGRRSKFEAARLKGTGVTAGVPDLLLAVVTSRAPGLFIEMKVGRNKSSEAQRTMQMSLSRQGYRICIVYSFEQFRADVVQHMGR